MSARAAAIPLTAMDHTDPQLLCELEEAVRRVAQHGTFIGGEAVAEFEASYAAWCEAPHAVGVSSGTDALTLALRALEIGAGDEVIVPANTFIATAEAVSATGARPRFADVDPDTQLLTADTVRTVLTPSVRCIVPVHLFGRTVELEPIMALAGERDLLVVEDAAQAHGARYRGRRVGTIGDAGAFSFYPSKNLGAWGDAGAVVTAREDLAETVRLLRSHGESPRYHHRRVGTTARLDALQASVLSVKLGRLEECNTKRRRVAGRLRELLADNRRVTPPPPAAERGDHVYHQFVIRTGARDQLQAFLAGHDVASAIHYPVPVHRAPAYAALGQPDVAPCALKLAREILSLPMFPAMSDAQIERIGDLLSQFDHELSESKARVG